MLHIEMKSKRPSRRLIVGSAGRCLPLLQTGTLRRLGYYLPRCGLIGQREERYE